MHFTNIIEWLVGGSIKVDYTILYYNIVEKSKQFINNRAYTLEDDIKLDYKNNSSIIKGEGIWSDNHLNVKPFVFEFNLKHNEKIQFIIIARVDGFMKEIIESDPKVPPQSHFVNLRKSFNYQIGNDKSEYNIKGKEFIYKTGEYSASM